MDLAALNKDLLNLFAESSHVEGVHEIKEKHDSVGHSWIIELP